MIIFISLVLTIFFAIMTAVHGIRKDPERAGTFLIMALAMYMTYSTAMYSSSFEYKAAQLEWLVSVGLYQF